MWLLPFPSPFPIPYTSRVQCLCHLRPAFDELDVCYLIAPARGCATYVGWTRKVPWYRCEQHNGVHAGGTSRLLPRRPWHVVAYVHGFHDRGNVRMQQWARRFETAWQLGWKGSALASHALYMQPHQGVKGKLQVLKALLDSPSWSAHRLSVCIVRSSHGGLHTTHARNREKKYRALLDPWPAVTTVDHL